MSEDEWTQQDVKILVWVVCGVWFFFAVLFLILLMMFRGSFGFILMALVIIFTGFFLFLSIGICFW